MATLAPPPPRTEKPERRRPSGGGRGPTPPHGLGFGGEGGGGAASLPESRYYTGMWLGLAGIVMVFTAFTSAYFVRKGLSDDWRPLALPPLLWVNTLLLVASSGTLEMAKRSYPMPRPFQRWWIATIALGGLFLAGQLTAWQQLAAAGVYVDTNPSSSFFYLLTASHAVHLAGGLGALLWLTWRLFRGGLTKLAVGVTALYWHFMDGLWVYLMLLLVIWR